MTTLQHRPPTARDLPVLTPDAPPAQEAPPAPAGANRNAARYVFATVRIGLGWMFLWAFLDKLFGLGFSTPAAGAWIDGGHPTAGFLGRSAKGPFAELWQGAAGTWWADWLFMLGLAGIGLALILGIGMRVAAATGALLYVLMWTVVLPPATNPFLDDHLINAAVLAGLALINAGDTLGLGRWWAGIPLVRKMPWLR